ncbi:MAG: hypothetical protein DWH91_04360 [Planctomycetota bacterium]|nr:MAG: hypothetical protein DWH91_04360 [Planctomycetota bacterium]
MTIFTRTWLVVASVSLLAGWCSAQPAPYFDGVAPGWGAGPVQRPYVPAYVQTQLIPDSRRSTYDLDSVYNLNLHDLVDDSWIKFEYVFANFEKPGETLLGAPMGSVPDPRLPFEILTPNLTGALARVADASAFDLSAQNGYRTSFGLTTFRGFDLEGSYIGMQDMTSFFSVGDLPGDPLTFPGQTEFYATSLLDDGSPGSRVILYDHSFDASLHAQSWSADLNIVLDSLSPDNGLQFKPLFGVRYHSYDESLTQHGRFDNSSGLDPLQGVRATPIENEILSSTSNRMVLGQLGFKAELVDKWFTIGVAPKIGLGSNTIDALVRTEDLRDSFIDPIQDDGVTLNSTSNVIFGSLFDANAYFSVRINSWLSVTGSGYFWFMPNVARADQTIVYDDLGVDLPSNMNPRMKTRSMTVQGFTVGAQITF